VAFEENIMLGLILGSGIDLSDEIISNKQIISEESSGIHDKVIYTATIDCNNIIVFKGRKHFYEGYSIGEICSNINIAAGHKVKNILITNAAGGINENFIEGDIMMINSHINFNSKLKNKKNFNPYNTSLRNKFRKVCIENKIKFHEGVYGCLSGPTYETKSEIRMLKKIGADAMGMSTVPEVIESFSSGINVIAVSVITNLLRENNVEKADHNNIVLTAQKASQSLNLAIKNLLSELN